MVISEYIDKKAWGLPISIYVKKDGMLRMGLKGQKFLFLLFLILSKNSWKVKYKGYKWVYKPKFEVYPCGYKWVYNWGFEVYQTLQNFSLFKRL